MIAPEEITRLLKEELPESDISVYDLKGTQDHFKVIVIADAFEGLMLVKRHQMVYKALKEPLKGPLHALTIQAYTQKEWQAKTQSGEPTQDTPKPQMRTPQQIKL